MDFQEGSRLMSFCHCCQRGQHISVTTHNTTGAWMMSHRGAVGKKNKEEQEAACMANFELNRYLSPWVPGGMHKLPLLFLKGYLLRHL